MCRRLQAEWILEKFWAWTDCNGHPENALTRDELLDNVMLYWLTASATSSARLYWESFGKEFQGGRDRGVSLPTGCSIFPKEVPVPRSWAEKRYRNIVYWNELDRGGHFAAFEQPALFVDELRACFRLMRRRRRRRTGESISWSPTQRRVSRRRPWFAKIHDPS